MSISYTTRPKRKSEVDGMDYFLSPKKNLRELQAKDFFIENAKVFDHLYGTPKNFVEKTYLKELMYFLTLIGRCSEII